MKPRSFALVAWIALTVAASGCDSDSGDGSGTTTTSESALLGSWDASADDPETRWVLTFFEDGAYAHYTSTTGNDPCDHTEGGEYGTYVYDEEASTLTVEVDFDENGCHGLSDLEGEETAIEVTDDELQLVEGGEPVLRVQSDDALIAGAWIPSEGTPIWVLTLHPDGRFTHYTSRTGDDPCDYNEGGEYGTYEFDDEAGTFTPTIAFNDNGCHGLSDIDATPVSAELDEDTLILDEGLGLERVGD